MARSGVYENLWLQELRDYEPQSIILQNWEIKAFLDKGTFSRIFLVSHYRTGEMAALKFIPNPIEMADCSVWGSPEERFHRMRFDASKKEAEIMDRFHGENHVVQYLEKPEFLMRSFKNEQGERVIRYAVLICMPLYQNHRKWLPRVYGNRRMSLKLGIDIAKALVLFEEKGVYHRDIKPGNVLMNGNGDFCLGDVGEAKLESEFTTTGFHGTRPYMAPEVYNLEHERSRMRSDHRSDIYSLGIILYRLFNHQQFPFLTEKGTLTDEATESYRRYKRENRLEGEDAYMNDGEKARLLRYDGLLLPPPGEAEVQLADVILKACAYHREDRWQTAKALHDALVCCLEGRPVKEEKHTEPEKVMPAVSAAPESIARERTDDSNPIKYIYEQSMPPAEKRNAEAKAEAQDQLPREELHRDPGNGSSDTGKAADSDAHEQIRQEPVVEQEQLDSPIEEISGIDQKKPDDESKWVERVVFDTGNVGDEAHRSGNDQAESSIDQNEADAHIEKTTGTDQKEPDSESKWTERIVFNTGNEESESYRFRNSRRFDAKTEGAVFLDAEEEPSAGETLGFDTMDGESGWKRMLMTALIIVCVFVCIQVMVQADGPIREIIRQDTAAPRITATPKAVSTPKPTSAPRKTIAPKSATSAPANTPLSSVFSYTTNSHGGITITKYIGPGNEYVTIPERINGKKVTVIGSRAFEDSTITGVNLPESLQIIEEYAFWNCRQIKKVTLHEGLDTLSGGSFGYCSMLEEINIPASVNTIGSIIQGSTNIKRLTVAEDSTWIYKKNNLLIMDARQGKAVIGVIGSPMEVVIPDGIEVLWNGAFRDQDSVKTVDIPSGVKEIKDWCFRYCSNLEAVMLPDTIDVIGELVFADCPNLKTIYGCNGRARELAKELGATYIEVPVRGARGTHVLRVKNMLKEWGYYTKNATYDNEFNDIMVERLKAFQKNNGLQQTGRYDMATMKKMTEARNIVKGQWFE